MVDASLVLDAIVAVSIAAGAFFAVWELRDMSKARRTELVIHLSQYVNSPAFMTTYLKVLNAEFKGRKGAEEACSPGELTGMADFFETLGYLVKNKDVNAEPVRELMAPMVVKMWDKLKPYTLEMRRDFFPHVLWHFEWLANYLRGSLDDRERKASLITGQT